MSKSPTLDDFAAEHGTTDSIQPDEDTPRHLTKVVLEGGVNTWDLSSEDDPLDNSRDPVAKNREFFCLECRCRVTRATEGDREYGHGRGCSHMIGGGSDA